MQVPDREIGDEDFLTIMKCRSEKYLNVEIRMDPRSHDRLLDELIRCYKSDEQNSCSEEWNDLRVGILKEALETNLYPTMERMLVEVRLRKAKDRVGNQMQKELENQLRVPPYVYRSVDGTPETPKNIMALCYAEPSEIVVINEQGEVVSYKSINLSVPFSGNHINAAFKDNEAHQLMSFLDEQRPDVIVIGSGGGLKCRTLKAQFERLVSACESEGILHRTIDVLLSEQSVAYKYSHSPRCMQEFPRYPPTRLMAVSLARKLQDPLRELSGLCIGLSEDILSLNLHQLQGMLDKHERVKFTQRAFINVVNDVGVDINLAADKQIIFGNTLQFVAGLGPRKAQELLRIISQYGCVQVGGRNFECAGSDELAVSQCAAGGQERPHGFQGSHFLQCLRVHEDYQKHFHVDGRPRGHVDSTWTSPLPRSSLPPASPPSYTSILHFRSSPSS